MRALGYAGQGIEAPLCLQEIDEVFVVEQLSEVPT